MIFGEGQKHELQFERIVFFSDAVFAIAITLLIIEVKVPHLEHSATSREFLLAILKLLPNLIGYFFSFLVIGAYWVGHHRIYGVIVDWDYGLVWRNIYFLLAIAFMPFATAFFSEYVTSFVPIVIYASTFALAGIFQIMQFRYAYRKKLIDASVTEYDFRLQTWRMAILPAVALLTIAIAFFMPYFAPMAFMIIPFARRMVERRFGAKIESEDGLHSSFDESEEQRGDAV